MRIPVKGGLRSIVRALLLLATLLLAAGHAASAPQPPVENFAEVAEGVFRSGQPGPKEFRLLVKRHGIRSVLNLRRHHDDDREARGLPLTLYHVPMRAGNIREGEILEALRVLRDAPKPILVHCWHGSDRTGCIVALYRMVLQGRPREEAIREFTDPRYGYHAGVYPNLERTLREVDIGALRDKLTRVPPLPEGGPEGAPTINHFAD